MCQFDCQFMFPLLLFLLIVFSCAFVAGPRPPAFLIGCLCLAAGDADVCSATYYYIYVVCYDG